MKNIDIKTKIKTVLLVSVVASSTLLFIITGYTNNLHWYFYSKREKLTSLIIEDISFLSEQTSFDKVWRDVSKINISINSTHIKRILENESLPISTNPSGKLYAEFNFIQADEKDSQIILQISIFDKISQNKLYELARIYDLFFL